MFESPRWVREPIKIFSTVTVLAGCHTSPLASDALPKIPENVDAWVQVEPHRNEYQEHSLSLETPPQTPEAAGYKSNLFKYATEHIEYRFVQNNTLSYESALKAVKRGAVPDSESLAMLCVELSHLIYPDLHFIRQGKAFQTPLSKIQERLGVLDTKGIIDEVTFRALDAAWTPREQQYRELENEWKKDCETYNLQSLIKGTTGNQLFDRLAILRDRAWSATSLRLLPDHLKKFRAGQGNVFLYAGDEFEYSVLRDEPSTERTQIHEDGHNILFYGLPGKSGKGDTRFPGAAAGEGNGSNDQLPFLYAAYGGKRVPKNFVDADGNVTIYEGPAGEYYSIAWRSLLESKNDAINKERPVVNADPQEVLPFGFVSGYATRNALEDFAETFAYTITIPDQMKKWVDQYGGDLKTKYDFIRERVLDPARFAADSGFGE